MAAPSGELPPEPAGSGGVVLELGEDVGAVVLTAAATYEGAEVEFRPAGGAWTGRHVAFHRRELPGRSIVAAVLPGLTQGSWEARLIGRQPTDGDPMRFEVVGGRVTTCAGPG